MKKILVVDDEPGITLLLRKFLSRSDFGVTEANSGQEALSVLDKNGSFDLVILDNKMPGISGKEVVKTIRDRKMDVRVILLTGSLGEAEGTVEADIFLRKPLDLNVLLKKINELLNA
ncbi:MAG: response regulator [Candidatus Omnitrophota bacterium]